MSVSTDVLSSRTEGQSFNSSKALLALCLGHAVERYEVFLFACYSAVLAPIFFPSVSPVAGVLASFGTFASGFIMRPLGGVIFGCIGDRYGRRVALMWSIIPVSIICFIVAVLPTYETIGVVAPICLLSLRLLQGVFVGGEYSGAIIYFFESTSEKRKGVSCGMICALGFLGALLATATSSLPSLLPHVAGWRIGFILGGLLGIAVFIMRLSVHESVDFKRFQDSHKSKISLHPFKDPSRLLLTFFLGAMSHIPLYVSTVFMSFLLLQAGLSHAESLAVTSGILALWFVTLLCMGYVADYIGQEKMIMLALVLLCIAPFPLLYWIGTGSHPMMSVITAQITFTLLGATFLGPSASYIPALFSIGVRYRSVASGITFGKAILGGTAPVICLYLYKNMPSTQYISLYICAISLVTLVMVIKTSQK